MEATWGARRSAWGYVALSRSGTQAPAFRCTQGTETVDLDNGMGWEHVLIFQVFSNYLLISPLTL